MTPTTERETTIDADPNLPSIRIAREFDAPVERVRLGRTGPGGSLGSGVLQELPTP